MLVVALHAFFEVSAKETEYIQETMNLYSCLEYILFKCICCAKPG